jgi:hypothetical protein
LIIAVDFDGVLVEDKFPEIGEPDTLVFKALKMLQQRGHKLVLWTSRVGDRLTEAVNLCSSLGLEFDAINDGEPGNVNQYGTNPRKVYADIYVDDRSIWYSRGLLYAWLNEMLKEK